MRATAAVVVRGLAMLLTAAVAWQDVVRSRDDRTSHSPGNRRLDIFIASLRPMR